MLEQGLARVDAESGVSQNIGVSLKVISVHMVLKRNYSHKFVSISILAVNITK
jgi:hypothetical protein